MPKYRKYVEMDIRDFRAAILKDKLSKETTLNIASLRRQASNRAAAKNSRKRKMGEEVTRRRIKITPPPFQSTSQLDALMMASGVLALVGMGKN